MLKKILIAAGIFSSLITTAHADFFIPTVEASYDRGLVLEIMLQCRGRMSGKKSSSIMTYEKTGKRFCTAKNKCYNNARSAAIESCNSDELMLSKLK